MGWSGDLHDKDTEGPSDTVPGIVELEALRLGDCFEMLCGVYSAFVTSSCRKNA